jgi:anaerobic selenocysteine-containing dehydrogenase
MNYGVQRAENGGTAVRAIAMLPALTGAWKHRGGGGSAFNFRAHSSGTRRLWSGRICMLASPLGGEARVVNMSRAG